MPAKKSGPGKPQGPRELIRPTPNDPRYIRRADEGKFTKDQVDVNRSRSIEARQAAAGEKAKTKVKPGYGDRGDVKKK